MLETKISLFKDTFSKEVKDFSVEKMATWISTGFWKDQIEALRKMTKEERNKEKVKLPGITWSGTFKERQATKVESYSSLVCLDIDNIQLDTINHLKSQLAEDSCVLLAFISPSNNGLKIVVSVDSPVEHHKAAFLHLQNYFQEKYNIEIDKSGKDVSRLCFVSYDPFMLIKNAVPFVVDIKYGVVDRSPVKQFHNTAPVLNTSRIFDLCIKWIERTHQYVEGNRNNYLHGLACAMNRCGVALEETTQLLNDNFDLPEAEITQACKSAYFHHRTEHGSVAVKTYGDIENYVAPAYETKYDDDVIWNDIKRFTAMLYSKNFPKEESMEIIAMISRYYASTKLIDIQKKDLLVVINEAIDTYQKNLAIQSSKDTLDYMIAEDLLSQIIKTNSQEGVVPTGFKTIDDALRGGMVPGNAYGIIGTDMTFKSILAQFLSVKSAVNDIPSLYLNGEMSGMQWYERLASMTINVKLYDYIKGGILNESNHKEFIERLKLETNGNLFFSTGSGWTEKSILASIDNIKLTTGKEIKMVIIDGITQMAWGKENEIMATTTNAMVCKEIAKKAHEGKGVVVLALFHVSGENNKLYRATGLKVRGGVKTLANLDGYFSTSLFEDSDSDENSNDIKYAPGKFYLRFTDKRGAGGIVNSIIAVPPNLRLEQEFGDPSNLETNRSTFNNNR